VGLARSCHEAVTKLSRRTRRVGLADAAADAAGCAGPPRGAASGSGARHAAVCCKDQEGCHGAGRAEDAAVRLVGVAPGGAVVLDTELATPDGAMVQRRCTPARACRHDDTTSVHKDTARRPGPARQTSVTARARSLPRPLPRQAARAPSTAPASTPHSSHVPVTSSSRPRHVQSAGRRPARATPHRPTRSGRSGGARTGASPPPTPSHASAPRAPKAPISRAPPAESCVDAACPISTG